jgi:hypothetical protein
MALGTEIEARNRERTAVNQAARASAAFYLSLPASRARQPMVKMKQSTLALLLR